MGIRKDLGWEFACDLNRDEKVVDIETVFEKLDEIEKKVTSALKLIEKITGIDDIEECTKILDDLATDLY